MKPPQFLTPGKPVIKIMGKSREIKKNKVKAKNFKLSPRKKLWTSFFEENLTSYLHLKDSHTETTLSLTLEEAKKLEGYMKKIEKQLLKQKAAVLQSQSSKAKTKEKSPEAESSSSTSSDDEE